MTTAFSTLLAQHRRAARLSQAELAGRAGLSQRHLSFLETGRAQPGSRAIARLIMGLLLGPADTDRLLAAAGLMAPRPAEDWQAARFAPVRAIIDKLLCQHTPSPAYVLDRAGTVLQANASLDALLSLTGRDLWAETGGRRNLYDLSLHPAGLVAHMAHAEQLVPAILQRLRRAADRCDAAAATLARVRQYPAARKHWGLRAPSDHGVIEEVYLVADKRLSFFAVTSTFGAADAAATTGIEIECLVPADAASAALVAMISPFPSD